MTPKPTTDQVIPETAAAPLDGGLNQPSSVIPERPTAPSDGGMVEALAKRLRDKEDQLRAYLADRKDWDSAVNKHVHAVTEGRIAQINQVAHWLSALAASAPSCLVGEKDLETGQHLIADRLGAISDTEKGAA